MALATSEERIAADWKVDLRITDTFNVPNRRFDPFLILQLLRLALSKFQLRIREGSVEGGFEVSSSSEDLGVKVFNGAGSVGDHVERLV